MPNSVPSMDDHYNLLERIEVLESAEQQREDRHEFKMEPEEKVEAAYKFEQSPWFGYVEEKFLQFEDDGYYNADDEETHIFDELCESFDKSTAFAFRNAYRPIKAVVTRLLMRKYSWSRPPTKRGERLVTKIRSSAVDPYLWKHDPIGFAWLREWHEQKAIAMAKRKKSNDGCEG